MKSKTVDLFSICMTKGFAVLLIAGGIIGYLKVGSIISLLSGICFGTLLYGCGCGMKKSAKPFAFTAIGLTVLLAGSFFFRAITTHKILPTVLGAISLSVFLILSYRLAFKKL